MRLFYNKNISKTDLKVNLEKEETKHLTKVLRKKIGDLIYITNGQGVLFETKINFINKNSTELLITKNTVHSKSKVKCFFLVSNYTKHVLSRITLQAKNSVALRHFRKKVCCLG